MTTSHWQRQHSFRIPDISTDVVIIGGGYAGLATAYWITEMRPDLKITILERSYCGAGASGRNAGFLTIGSASFYKSLTLKWGEAKALEIYQFASESLEAVYQNILKASPEVKFERTSSMTLFRTHEQHDAWQDTRFSPDKFNFFWKDEANVPARLKSRFIGAYETSPEYEVNPVQLLTSMKTKLESRKVQFVENSSGFAITDDGVLTEVNTIKCSKVVLALNGYFPQFHPSFQSIIVPRRAQMLAVELEEDFDYPSLYYDPPERVYWRKTQDKVLVIGGKRLLDEQGEIGDFEKISPVIQSGLEQYLRDQLGLTYKVINRWSGTMGFTDHELPLIDKVKAPLDCYMIGGFSGHGMGLGFRSGMEMASLVTDQKTESFFNYFKKADFQL